MHNLIKLTINAGIFLILSFSQASFSQNISLKQISQRIESSFNSNNLSKLSDLLDKEIALDIETKYLNFLKEFPNAQWTIKPGKNLKDKRQSIDLIILAKKKVDGQTYSLKTNQTIALTIEKGRIVNREILSEYSILATTSKPPDITLQIPNFALTGSRYDVDIIINKPLEHSIIAGSLVLVKNENPIEILEEKINLKPMGSGGIFKSVQAPLNEGEQRWGAIIAHPDGVITITKLVKIVSKEKDIISL